MEQSIRCGIDIAKIVFQIHGVNATSGETVMVKKIARHEMLRFFANKPPILIGIEACGGAHNWARELQLIKIVNHHHGTLVVIVRDIFRHWALSTF